jgi:hypothetical protein
MRLAARTCHDRFTRRELLGIVDRAGVSVSRQVLRAARQDRRRRR